MNNEQLIATSVLMMTLAACGGDVGPSPTPVTVSPVPTPSPPPAPAPAPSSSQFVVTPDIPFGTGPTASGSLPLLLDVYRPQLACDTYRPTVIFVHGGGFVSGSRKSSYVDAIARELTRRGFNLISISYRLQGDNPVISGEFTAFERDFQAVNTAEPRARVTAFTAAVEDAVRALRWSVNNAGTYCIDPARFAMWGSSAGAFTSMHVAYSLDEYAILRPPVRVAVDYWGGLFRASDLEAGDAPLFVMHGTADSTVPYTRAQEITERAQSVGVPFTLYSIIGGQHGFDGTGFFDLAVDGQSIVVKTAAFVEAHMRDGGQPVYERRDMPR